MLIELDNAANSEYGEFLMKLLAVASPYPYKCSYMAFTLHCAPWLLVITTVCWWISTIARWLRFSSAILSAGLDSRQLSTRLDLWECMLLLLPKVHIQENFARMLPLAQDHIKLFSLLSIHNWILAVLSLTTSINDTFIRALYVAEEDYSGGFIAYVITHLMHNIQSLSNPSQVLLCYYCADALHEVSTSILQ